MNSIIRKGIKGLYYYMKYLLRIPHDIIRRNKIDHTNHIAQSSGITHCRFGKYNYVAPDTGMYNVTVGNYCSIGPQIIIGGMEHSHWWYSMSPLLSDKAEDVPETVIGNDVWIGANCVIKAGITIGDGAVVGAQSFVNKDVPPYAVVVGTPAKVRRIRFSDDIICCLRDSRYWEKDPKDAITILNDFSINHPLPER